MKKYFKKYWKKIQRLKKNFENNMKLLKMQSSAYVSELKTGS